MLIYFYCIQQPFRNPERRGDAGIVNRQLFILEIYGAIQNVGGNIILIIITTAGKVRAGDFQLPVEIGDTKAIFG